MRSVLVGLVAGIAVVGAVLFFLRHQWQPVQDAVPDASTQAGPPAATEPTTASAPRDVYKPDGSFDRGPGCAGGHLTRFQ